MARELANGRAGEDERRAFASPYVTTVYSGGLERPAGVVVTPRRGPGWSRVRALRGPAGSLAAPRAHGHGGLPSSRVPVTQGWLVASMAVAMNGGRRSRHENQ